jgi:hypothetical protein
VLAVEGEVEMEVVEVVDVVDVVVARFRVCTLLIDVDAFLDLLRSLHFDEKVK